MKIQYHKVLLKKRFPLKINRGVKGDTYNVFVSVEADKAMFEQVVKSCTNFNVKVRVDANGGWDLPTAIHMSQWLADRGVSYIEQPLKEGNEAALPDFYKVSVLPIYVDESFRFAENIPHWAHAVHGVNFKLMKCGGITERLRIIATTKAFGLKTMVGCMSESSISIAAAALSGVLDHIDLDSRYNLAPDPAEGAPLINGITLPTDNIGHGVIRFGCEKLGRAIQTITS